jgi:uncharacterized protein (TIGR02001 family)
MLVLYWLRKGVWRLQQVPISVPLMESYYMIKSRIAVAGALLAVAGAATAGTFTVTPTIATDYDFRGISQTDWNADRDDVLPLAPAFQLGGTYTFDNGFYAGIWGSNVAFGDGLGGKASKPDFEIDYTVGYAGGDAVESFGYDFGATYYTYPSSGSDNTWEAYAGISKGWFSGKLWYSPDYFSSDESGYYLEGNGAFPLPVMDLTLLAHVGISDGDYYSNSVTDYSVGVAKSFGAFSTNLKWVDGTDGLDGRLVLAVSTTLPWAE